MCPDDDGDDDGDDGDDDDDDDDDDGDGGDGGDGDGDGGDDGDDGFVQQVSKSESASGAVEQSYHHVLTLTHLVPWHYASMLLTGTCTCTMYSVEYIVLYVKYYITSPCRTI